MSKDKPNIFIEEGIQMTTSLEVARIFEKSHYSDLRAIRNRSYPKIFQDTILSLLKSLKKTKSGMLLNKSYFKMTRDGFNLIAMGFTGGFTIFGVHRTMARGRSPRYGAFRELGSERTHFHVQNRVEIL